MLPLLVMLQVPSTLPTTESSSAAAIFVEGCLQGSIKLTKERGAILTDGQIRGMADVANRWVKTRNHSVIKFYQPAGTYLSFAEYEVKSKGAIKRTCTLISRVISKTDAQQVFLIGSLKKDVVQTWRPYMYSPEWIIDQPKLGFRKRLRHNDDGSIQLEFSMYVGAEN